MLWLTWIGWAVVLAALFSVIKLLDQLNHSVERIDARLDHLATRLAEVVAAVNTINAQARLERGPSSTDSLLELAADRPASRVLATAEPRGSK